MSRPDLLASCFATYCEDSIAPSDSPRRVYEAQHAFYGGVHAALRLLDLSAGFCLRPDASERTISAGSYTIRAMLFELELYIEGHRLNATAPHVPPPDPT